MLAKLDALVRREAERMKLSMRKMSFWTGTQKRCLRDNPTARIFPAGAFCPAAFSRAPGAGAPRAKRQRMGQDNIDTQFLKDTVADVLVRACSECAVSQPKDPVGFVAGWLDQYVANDTILKKHEAAKQLAAEQEAAIEQVGGPLPF